MTRGNETDVPAVEAVEAFHDAFARSLYLYAWSLLGEPGRHVGGEERAHGDPVGDAVHEALVAGIGLESELSDPADRGPWLYALARTACQRRGFAHTCPYTRLATVPDEAPVARMFSRLPASHRELVELNLRHALPTSAVARVLGLEPRICGELSRSAIRRAAEGLEDPAGAGPAETGPDQESPGAAWRAQVQRVCAAMALLPPPSAPPGLRARIVHTCTSPEAAEERARIAADMRPLTSDGYPVHRSRPPGAPVVEAAEDGGTVEMPLPRALPGDRLTTSDHPVHDDARSPLPSPGHDPLDETGPSPRRWPLPAVSGLATVAVALGLWWWASSVGGPSTMIDTGPAAQGERPGLAEVEGGSTASDGKPGTEHTAAAPEGAGPERSGPEASQSGAPGLSPPEPEDTGHDERPGDGPDKGVPEAPGGGPGPSETPEDDRGPDQGSGDEEGPGDEPGGEQPESGSGGLLDGLLVLLFGSGQGE